MPDATRKTLEEMTVEEFAAWKEANAPSFAGIRVQEQTKLPQPTLAPSSPQDYDATEKAWLTGDVSYDFTCPSGAQCRLKDMPIEELAATGMLDRLTRLSGITQKLIDVSQGVPPGKEKETAQAIGELLSVLNVVIPMIVVQPKVWPVPPEGEARKADRVYPESIQLADRVAIIERAAGGVMKFDNFRR